MDMFVQLAIYFAGRLRHLHRACLVKAKALTSWNLNKKIETQQTPNQSPKNDHKKNKWKKMSANRTQVGKRRTLVKKNGRTTSTTGDQFCPVSFFWRGRVGQRRCFYSVFSSKKRKQPKNKRKQQIPAKKWERKKAKHKTSPVLLVFCSLFFLFCCPVPPSFFVLYPFCFFHFLQTLRGVWTICIQCDVRYCVYYTHQNTHCDTM